MVENKKDIEQLVITYNNHNLYKKYGSIWTKNIIRIVNNLYGIIVCGW